MAKFRTSTLQFVRDRAAAMLGAWGVMKSCGICWNMKEKLTSNHDRAEVQAVLEALFRAWPEFSGEIDYPVTGGPEHSNAQAYNLTSDLWDKSTEYGRARWRLLQFIRDYVDGELERRLDM